MNAARVAWSVAALLSAACTVEQEQVADWQAVTADALSESQQAQLARATEARDALFGALSGRLLTALEEGTPAEAIGVCKDAAPQVAAEISSARGVAIGRTSQRLRNPANAAPAWAAAHVASAAEEQACLSGPEGELGVLLPIRTAGLCSSCHGPADALDAEVAAVIATDYPADRAVGYAEGDLRGWFWVEVGP